MAFDHFYLPQRAHGLAVRNRRLELRFTQRDLSKRCDLHETYISDVERGRRNISWSSSARLIAALKWSMEEFGAAYERELRALRQADEP